MFSLRLPHVSQTCSRGRGEMNDLVEIEMFDKDDFSQSFKCQQIDGEIYFRADDVIKLIDTLYHMHLLRKRKIPAHLIDNWKVVRDYLTNNKILASSKFNRKGREKDDHDKS
jgi:hypothetical protein